MAPSRQFVSESDGNPPQIAHPPKRLTAVTPVPAVTRNFRRDVESAGVLSFAVLFPVSGDGFVRSETVDIWLLCVDVAIVQRTSGDGVTLVRYICGSL